MDAQRIESLKRHLSPKNVYDVLNGLNFSKVMENVMLCREKPYLFFVSESAVGRGNALWGVDLEGGETKEIEVNWKGGKLTEAEKLLRERMRSYGSGVTKAEMNSGGDKFLLWSDARLALMKVQDAVDGKKDAKVFFAEGQGERMTLGLSCDEKLLCFTQNGDMFVTFADDTTMEKQITFEHAKDPERYAGEARFIYQEEFDRYVGYWWSPKVVTLENGLNVYQILYTVEDEKDVMEYTIATSDMKGVGEKAKYPVVGTPNTVTTVHLATIVVDMAKKEVVDVSTRHVKQIDEMFPWKEYISRAGWCKDGEHFYVHVMDRKQQQFTFARCEAKNPDNISIVHREESRTSVIVTDILRELEDGSFIFASEESGFRRLYLLEQRGGIFEKRLVTVFDDSLGQQIIDDKIVVDEKAKIVYFIATTKDHIHRAVYGASYANVPAAPNCVMLTDEGVTVSSFDVCAYEKATIVATVESNTKTNCKICTRSYTSFAKKPEIGYLSPSVSSFPNVQFLSCVSPAHGETLHTGVIFPMNYDPNKEYPVMVCVYGGPSVQRVVDNDSFVQQTERLLYSAFGMFVVVTDNVGTDNRGTRFRDRMYGKMGHVEIQDQVLGVQNAAKHFKMDLTRVGISGWSYGGYASLLALAQRPDFFKLAFCGAPVTDWRGYDTGYTERYMGVLPESDEAYTNSSVMHFASGFPKDFSDVSLHIFHGTGDDNVHFSQTEALVETFLRDGIPYTLQVYPRDRHGLRSQGYVRHKFATMMNILIKKFNL